jgi:hypothetical protein
VQNNPVNFVDPEGLDVSLALPLLTTPGGATVVAGIAVGVFTYALTSWAIEGTWLGEGGLGNSIYDIFHPEAPSTYYLGKAREKGRNWATEEAKVTAQTSPGKSACDILDEMLEAAKCSGDSKRIKDIERAQKFMGCRNIGKRRNR